MIYLFDFDGTLVDSMPTFSRVMLRILDEAGIAYGDDIIKTVTPLGYAGAARHFISLGLSLTEREAMERMNEYAQDDYLYRIQAKETVRETLHALRARGDSLNVLTASPHAVLDGCLARVGLLSLFDNVWSSDDFGTSKSDPDIYRRAAERLGCSTNELTFLDDNLGACLAARAAGARVLGVFDPSSADSEDEMRKTLDGYVRTFSELL